MHTLYSFPMSCSLAVALRLTLLEVPYRSVHVARGPGRRIDDGAFTEVNPKRKVPALVLPDGTVLTEVVSILNHLDVPDGRRERLEWLAFLATELHQQILGPQFDPHTPPAAIEDAVTRLMPPVLDHLESHLLDRPTLLGGAPDGADCYLLWALLLVRAIDRELLTPGLKGFVTRMLAIEAVGARVQQERARL